MSNQFQEVLTMEDMEMQEELFLLAEGSSRFIYKVDEDHILKAPFSEAGELQNRIEYDLYSEATGQQKEFLCPIVEGFIRVGQFQSVCLVMKKAQPLQEYENFQGERVSTIMQHFQISSFEELATYQDLKPLIQKYDLYIPDLEKITSWGMYEDHLVLIDYGCTNRIYEEHY